MAKRRKAQVLAIGASRVMQIRSNVINPTYSFYNAGGAVRTSDEFNLFIDKINYNPELVVISVDQFDFNKNYSDTHEAFNPHCYDAPSFSVSDMFLKCRAYWLDVLSNKITKEAFSGDNIGITARVKKNGFQSDGSYLYSFEEHNPKLASDYQFENTKWRIENKVQRFQAGSHIDHDYLMRFDDFLLKCQSRNIKVIAIIPPFALSINELLKKDGDYKYMDEIYPELSKIFSKYRDCELYNFQTVEGICDDNYIDGFHGDCVVYNKIISTIISKEPSFAKYFKSIPEINEISEKYIYRFQ